MDKVNAMQVFRRVVEAGSFSAVSREMSLTQSTVSKQVAALEGYLGSKLLNRSTRQLNLTDVGRRYYERCCQILDDLAEAETEMREQQSMPTGMLRINLPIAAGRIKILPYLWQFYNKHPDLKVDAIFDDRYIDLVKEGVDVAIRIGELADSSLIAKKIATLPRYLVASSSYIEKNGEPKTLHELQQHNCLVYSLLNTRNEWHFNGLNGNQTVTVHGRFSSNSPDAIRQAVIQGQGIAVILGWLVEEDIAQGKMKVILKDYTPTALDVSAVYPERRFIPAKVRLFIDYLQNELMKPLTF